MLTGSVTETLVLHDYLTQRGGAERVALLLATHLGGGGVTTSLYSPATTFPGFAGLQVQALLRNVPLKVFRSRAALAPAAAVAFLRHKQAAGVVLCSSSGWSHWTSTPSPVVVYCHTPPRWLWAPNDYFSGLSGSVSRLTGAAMSQLGRLDYVRAQNRKRYIANSTITQRRIHESYGLPSEVIPPPLTFEVDGPQEPVPYLDPGFILTISRARGYKNAELAAAAFSGGQFGTLVVVGGEASPCHDRSVVRLGQVSEARLRWLYENCGAVLALAHEDFGLTPVEGHAFGKPTIALRAGGYLETCTADNSVWVESLDVDGVRRGAAVMRQTEFDGGSIREGSRAHSAGRFISRVQEVLDDARD